MALQCVLQYIWLKFSLHKKSETILAANASGIGLYKFYKVKLFSEFINNSDYVIEKQNDKNGTMQHKRLRFPARS